jgi:hypothetical protein
MGRVWWVRKEGNSCWCPDGNDFTNEGIEVEMGGGGVQATTLHPLKTVRGGREWQEEQAWAVSQ